MGTSADLGKPAPQAVIAAIPSYGVPEGPLKQASAEAIYISSKEMPESSEPLATCRKLYVCLSLSRRAMEPFTCRLNTSIFLLQEYIELPLYYACMFSAKNGLLAIAVYNAGSALALQRHVFSENCWKFLTFIAR